MNSARNVCESKVHFETRDEAQKFAAKARQRVVGLVARCLASCQQTMAYDDRDGVPRVVVDLPENEWRELAALVGVGDDECA